MDRVGIYQAKAKLSELVDQAERGSEITITRHGKAVARLVPARPRSEPDRAKAFDDLDAFAKTIKARRFNLRKAIEWGRR